MQEIRDSIKRRHEYIMRRYQPIANIDKKEWDQMF